MEYKPFFDFVVDAAPFVLYTAVLIKLYLSWKMIKANADDKRREALAAPLLILGIVCFLFLASNVYALVVTGKTFLSLRVFQMFVLGNCLVYWMVINLITKDVVPAEGRLSEPAK